MISMMSISMLSILGADFLGHLGGNLDWNILAVLYGGGRTILLGDFLAFLNRDLLTRFHWFLKGFLGALLYRNLLAVLYRLLHRHLVTALLGNLVAMFTIASMPSSITTVTSITSVSTGSTDHFVSGHTLLLIGCLISGGTFIFIFRVTGCSVVCLVGCPALFLVVSLTLLSVSRLTALLVLGGTFLDVGCGVICHVDSLTLMLGATLDTDCKASNNEHLVDHLEKK